MTDRSEDLIARVLHAHRVLAEEKDLSPRNEKINKALSSLVGGVTQNLTAQEENKVLTNPRVREVRRSLLGGLSKAEGEMEKFWAEFFCARDNLSPEDLKEFIYWKNYESLVAGEVRCLPRIFNMSAGQSVAFVGAGPLPLTAIILNMKTGLRVTCVDNDPEACRLARVLCRRAGLTDIDVVCSSGEKHDYARHPAVIVASLVPDKKAVIDRIRSTSARTTFIGLRSAERLHTLLYDPVDGNEMAEAGFRYRRKTRHDPKTINTTLFGEVDSLNPGLCAQASNRRRPPAPGF